MTRQKELDGHNADDRQKPRNGTSLRQIEELGIHWQCDETKSNKTSVNSKTSSVRRIADLELEVLKDQEELQTLLEKLRCEAKQN